MNFLKFACILSLFLSGGVLLLVFLFTQSEDQAMLSNKAGSFMPGSFDSMKNKLVAILVGIFCASALTVASIETRARNSNTDVLVKSAKVNNLEKDGGGISDDPKSGGGDGDMPVKKSANNGGVPGDTKARVDY